MQEQLAFQKKLHEVFAEAQLRNSSYSLRAYARRLGLSPSALSEILHGKRRASRKLVKRTIERLALSPAEADAILGLFPIKGNGKKLQVGIPSERMELTMDQFHLISEWYHFAILSLAETVDFKSDEEWIAKRLNLKILEVKNAIARLLRLGLLAQKEDGTWWPTGIHYSTTDEVSDVALRKAHAFNLELARTSLERDFVSERDFISSTMAIDRSKLPLAKKMIREFRKKLSETLEVGEKNEVYKICINLFPLSNLNITKEEIQ
ncbi:MAG: TIGR02147 family protein [Oligoflexia bacterium]|nr:TIGR02147 family protein [Oligoflexia bacterium]MBF0365895.1 TIGR02147 family protein [Oligoflexia bacterium]